jgi:hypothetical protein
VHVIKSDFVYDNKDDEIDDKTLETGQIVDDWHSVGKLFHEITGDEEWEGNGPLVDQHHLNSLMQKIIFSFFIGFICYKFNLDTSLSRFKSTGS